ncbi:MAG TPA: sugar ABC transporter ATP-binding protein [Anaerolineae bacterium]|nr:sugar ABC transporter ATP-binding protein [Anaerolineae bacterium]
MNNTPLIQIKNISKKYPGVEALKTVSFEIQPRMVHALIGENGAGKSTLIKILSGAVSPDVGGDIYFNGEAFTPRSPKEAIDMGISTIYQIINLLPDRTVMHNVLLGQEPMHNGILDNTAMHEKTLQILDTLNASYIKPEMLVSNLKVGEKQVIEIAKALVNKSKLLIMDEATAALNQTEREALFNNIIKLRESGVTIIYVSHRLDEILELADNVTVLRDGQHILTSQIDEVTRDSLIESMIGRKLKYFFPKRVDKRGDEILRVENLYAGKELQGISFSLHFGEVLAVTGLSGCGKADLGKALYGTLPVDQGCITVSQVQFKASPSRSIKKKIIMLPEDRKADSLLQKLSIRRNVSLSVLRSEASNKLGLINQANERKIVTNQINALDIKTTSMEQVVTHLSGGNQQKVALGRCLAVEPDVFILLEPTQGIDIGVKFEIYQFITNQAALGKAILLITSELAEVMGLSHRVLVMRAGCIAAELNTEETDQTEILRLALGEIEALGA